MTRVESSDEEEEIILFKGRNPTLSAVSAPPMNEFSAPPGFHSPLYLPNYTPMEETSFSNAMNLSDDVDTLSFLGLGSTF
jgi:hypothetical protein